MNNLSDKVSSDREIKEKLVSRGVGALDDAELLSLLLAPSAGRSAIDVARRMLESEGGSLPALAEYGLTRLRMTEGLGMKSAAVVAAAFELGRRVAAQDTAQVQTVRDKRDVVELFAPMLSHLSHEEMWVLYLNTANRILEKRRLSQGGVSSIVVDCKLVVKRAIELLATSLIVVHNHPSGVAQPSGEDVEITERLAKAAQLFDIAVMDHIIISATGDFSFRQAGLIK